MINTSSDINRYMNGILYISLLVFIILTVYICEGTFFMALLIYLFSSIFLYILLKSHLNF